MNIWIASADNNVEKVKELLAGGQFTPNSKDENGYTPMHAASEYTHLDLLQFLVDEGGDVNVKDADGDTPLHACEQVSTAKLLIKFGAKVQTTNDEGLTPFAKAEEAAEFPELIEYLREVTPGAAAAPSASEVAGGDIADRVKVSMEDAQPSSQEIPLQVSEEQRAKLSEIIENGTDQDFEDYLKEVLGSKTQGDDVKRQKTE